MNPESAYHYFLYNADIPAHHPDAFWGLYIGRIVIRLLIGVFAILMAVPPLVWWERRLLGWMQQRQGPNRVGPFGLLQTIADGLKLLFKEDINPTRVDTTLFVLAPMIFLIPSLVTSAVIPWGASRVWGAPAPNVSIGVLYLLAWGSLAVYGIVMAGWSSNNKYSLLGGLRASAQMISYELGMGLAIICIVLMTGSLGLQDIVHEQGFFVFNQSLAQYIALPEWNVFKYFPMGAIATIVYMISMLAETNRAPFDLPEAETELVAGYHTEYTSMKFATFFLGEYANMIITSAIASTLFFGGFQAPLPILGHIPVNEAGVGIGILLIKIVNIFLPVMWLTVKVLALLYFFIWIRATLPRLRYDMLMKIGWQGLLPIALVNVLLVAIGMTEGYVVGLICWAVVFGIGLACFASSNPSKKFVTNVRRDTTLTMNASAVPYSAVPQNPGYGGQTLPPDAANGALGGPHTDREVELARASAGEKG